MTPGEEKMRLVVFPHGVCSRCGSSRWVVRMGEPESAPAYCLSCVQAAWDLLDDAEWQHETESRS